MKEEITLRVNGKQHTVNVDPATPLLYVLRNNLELNGPKYGCGLQQCGSCMVLLDGESTPSCRLPVSALKDLKIVTLEGLQEDTGKLHPLQEAFYEEQAAQCGFCLNGMLISGVALLEKNKKPGREEILEGLDRVLCRCGTHSRIIKAVETASLKTSR
ncbi:(2Fe-2S)-binding protein [Antarcticibacterium flavum]|uniref:(2Fe-2S)-binding protein n=1 Tax=Antarcticibacterium flavum TaxID=2058175 RepID=A0A5B7X632_9FLAO|nr:MULTISPECIES: (2Fe-2S)-binding protein [Antarcticibacterium]MCM4158401.1 (2Fe-2S)-binding protein [Antarcticibacterium sp. W02-3]QCY70161.1 (2Fe-2S)-binding protein [Antarcticibacterium flavum]